MNPKQKIEENIQKCEALYRLYKSTEYQSFLLPYLKAATIMPMLDVNKFKDKDAFIYEYQRVKERAAVYSELIKMFEGMETMLKQLKRQLDEKPKSYAI